MWFVEPNDQVGRQPVAASSDPSHVISVIESICSAAALDGFTEMNVGRIASETGLRTGVVERVIGELVACDLLRVRQNGRRVRFLEPGPSIRLVYRLVV
jgi:hypothetical protein